MTYRRINAIPLWIDRCVTIISRCVTVRDLPLEQNPNEKQARNYLPASLANTKKYWP